MLVSDLLVSDLLTIVGVVFGPSLIELLEIELGRHEVFAFGVRNHNPV